MRQGRPLAGLDRIYHQGANDGLRVTGTWNGSNWTAGATRQITLGFDGFDDTTGV